MRRFGWLMVVALVAVTMACGQQNDAAKKAAVSSKSMVTAKQVMKISQHAMETLQTYLQQQREDYLNQVETQLERLTSRVEKLQSKAAKAGEPLAKNLESTIQSFKNKTAAARLQLEQLKAATDQPWEPMKAGVNAALDDLEKEYDKVIDNLG
jgi:hypothetical protein